MTQRAPKVLFVDDDPALLEIVSQLMGSYSDQSWEVLTATGSAEALRILQTSVVDLLVIDVHMPVVDGPQLLKLLQRKYPSLLKVVLTGDATGAFRAECLASGAELFLEKPRMSEGWMVIHATLAELIKFKPESGFRGVLRRVGLQEVLQMECLSRNSSILEITANSVRGQVHIQEGEVVHAVAGQRKGETAFFHLFGLKGGDFSLHPFTPPEERTIDKGWESLLMEAAQASDEASEGFETDNPEPPTELEKEFETTLMTRLEASAPAIATESQPSPEAAPVQAARKCVEEILICAANGEVLYEWQCGKIDARVAFLECVSTKASQLAHRLPAGAFDRLEIEHAGGRCIVQVKGGHTLYVQTGPEPPQTAAKGNGKRQEQALQQASA